MYKVTSEDEEITYLDGVVVGKVQTKKTKDQIERVSFENDVPVKKEITIFLANGLKDVVKYYNRDKYYQHLQYEYRQ